MLREQHKFATKITSLTSREEYKRHMCGLCHALGDEYGLPYRMLTSNDMILLNMLINAQRLEEPRIIVRRCPLNPFKRVSAVQEVSCEFASSVAVGLAKINAEDDVRDSRQWSIRPRLANWIHGKPYQLALRNLKSLGFQTEILTSLTTVQADAQEKGTQNVAQPTATASSKLFAVTADLANNPENKRALSSMGEYYGIYVYLMDALRDFPKDMQRGDYNPLRRFGQQTPTTLWLSYDGLEMLLNQFEKVLRSIRACFEQLCLYRYENTIKDLVCMPLQTTIDVLAEKALRANGRKGLVFWRWQHSDILKAAVFVIPTLAVGAILTNHNILATIVDNAELDVTVVSCRTAESNVKSVLSDITIANFSATHIMKGADWLENLFSSMLDDGLCSACWEDCVSGNLCEACAICGECTVDELW